jgi:glycosyltransferase involved in cell wall biosynthesis
VKLAFLVNDLQLSGGIGVVVEHASRLNRDHGHDVTLVLVREQDQPSWLYRHLTGMRVANVADVRAERFDIAIATWWETTFSLFTVPADRYVYFLQSFEDRFYPPDTAERLGAALTHDLPVDFVTEAHWISDTITQTRPEVRCWLVRNGIAKDVFTPPDTIEPRVSGPLRVLIEGNPAVHFKHVESAVHAAAKMLEPKHVTVATSEQQALLEIFNGQPPVDRVVGPLSHAEMAELYAQTDVVLKLSAVEGMFGPPLEGFHKGATCVVTAVTGHDEYVEHGWNGMVVEWDDLNGTARTLDRLARDRRFLHFLRCNALATARAWPDWHQATQMMDRALVAVAASPAPDPVASSALLLEDLRAGVEAYRFQMEDKRHLAHTAAPILRLRGDPRVRRLREFSRKRSVRLATWPLRRWRKRVGRMIG